MILYPLHGTILLTVANTQHSSLIPALKERWILCGLCLLAAVHCLVFCAAFPLFDVDEFYHFDLAVDYSHLQVPRQLGFLSEESMQYIVIFSTWEYTDTNDTFQVRPWTLPVPQMAALAASRESRWRLVNYEALQPPLYYLVAGAWWRASRAAGFHDDFVVYLLRFLNAAFVMALVWLGWVAARLVFPGNIFIACAVAALLAVMPQSIFYVIGNDVLSPLGFGAAFVCLIKLWRAELPVLGLAIATGVALAATFLAKSSNVPLLGVSAILLAVKMGNLRRQGRLRAWLPSLGSLLLCLSLPVAAWMAWCKIHFGDWTGSAQVAREMGWTIKPFSEWWHHPLFTPHGLGIFLSGNVATLWQGEMLWHGRHLCLSAINSFYVGMSAIVIAAALIGFKKVGTSQRPLLWFALAASLSVLAFFGFLSILYDFHNCAYPSRDYPYFTSGRLLLGALVPFLLLFAFGLDYLLKRVGNTWKFVALALVVLFMLGGEIATNWPVFSSQYNWFNI